MREFSHKPVTFVFMRVQGGGVVETQAQLKKKLEQFSSQIYQIYLIIQTFKQQGNSQHIGNLAASKLEL